MKLRILVAGLVLGSAAMAAETGAELFQKALVAERGAGNLEEAIKLYQRIAREFASDRALAAKALVQEARCYEKLGKDNAVRIYEQVARDYKDQHDPSAAARSRLAVLRLAEHAAQAGMTQRRIDLPYPSTSMYDVLQTDGQREIYKDAATGALMMGDLAGKEKRVILKPKPGEQIVAYIPSRDFSIVSLVLRPGDGFGRSVLIKTDGTVLREDVNTEGAVDPCPPDWSWDDRYLYSCRNQPDGTIQLRRHSVADGEIRDLGRIGGPFLRSSPDGRFIAFSTSYEGPGKVSIMPGQGGEPEVVSENAHLVDWTRDGRYLIVTSLRSGLDALSLLPMKDGRAAGDPVFLRYGSCFFGWTVGNGGLVCHSTFPGGGAYEAWLGSLDSTGHPSDWKQISLRGHATLPWLVRWSPDSAQISYRSKDENGAWVIHLRTISSGEEREVYRGKSLGCIWAAQHPALFCTDSNEQLSSLALDSGRLEPLTVLPGFRGSASNHYFTTEDGQGMFWSDSDYRLFRLDLRTQQSTFVDRIPGRGKPFPNSHWLARRDKGQIEIRPMEGGDWKPLISTDETQMVFTPDGKWVLYHDVDSKGKHSLLRVSTAGGPPERVGDFPAVRKENGLMAISPDGKKIIAQAPGVEESWILENFEPKQTAAR